MCRSWFASSSPVSRLTPHCSPQSLKPRIRSIAWRPKMKRSNLVLPSLPSTQTPIRKRKTRRRTSVNLILKFSSCVRKLIRYVAINSALPRNSRVSTLWMTKSQHGQSAFIRNSAFWPTIPSSNKNLRISSKCSEQWRLLFQRSLKKLLRDVTRVKMTKASNTERSSMISLLKISLTRIFASALSAV